MVTTVADSRTTVFKRPPFRIQEEGWGEFDMQIGLTAGDKEHVIGHDLNFASARYESKHPIVSFTLHGISVPKNMLTFSTDIQEPQACPIGGTTRIRPSPG
jgi:transcription initiation factor IIF auxiliary subunit